MYLPKVGALGDIDIETCGQCCGRVKIISTIKDPNVIKKILDHISKTEEPIPPACTANKI